MIPIQKFRNLKLKEKNHSKSRNGSISWKTTSNNKFLYEMIKIHKLNEIKNKARRASEIMSTIGETIKPKKSTPKALSNNLNNLINPTLMKINYRRSLLVHKKLKDIDKMNEEFDHEYINQRYMEKDDKYNNYDTFSEEENEDANEKDTPNKNDINLGLNSEERRILKTLFMNKKGNDNRPFSEYKKFKKLKDLKSNIEYVCGIKLDEKKSNSKVERFKEELNKNTHYYIPLRNPTFMRFKNDEISFTPSRKYDKTKIYYEKSYDKFKSAKNDLNSKYINYSLLSNLTKNYPNKTKLIINNQELSPIRKRKNKIPIRDKNDKGEKGELKKLVNNNYKNNKFKTINNTSKSFHKIKFTNFMNNKNRNNYLDKFKVLKTENNISKRKKISMILKNLLEENYSLKNDLQFRINLMSSHLQDYKRQPKKKPEEINLDIRKIRKELKLDKLTSIIKESEIIVRNEKKMEKKLKKEDASILRGVVNKILQEDRLINKEIVINTNSLNNKLKKILERRVKHMEINENDDDENDKVQILKLFKDDNPDVFNMNHLSSLIKRYKTMKIK